ncbi:MAG: molybdenum cofactor guanylyltransferase MobA [Pseudomonadota bacterium]
MRPPGLILAGGLARRMGGGDKARLRVAGQPLIRHVIDRLGPQVSSLLLNANGDAARWDDLALPVLPDPMPGHPGPLAGVLAGLDWAAAQGQTAIVTAAADTPFLPLDLVERLQAVAGPSGLALAATADGPQPTFGLWPAHLRDDLRTALDGGLRKITNWTDRHGVGLASFSQDAFFNINTPADLKAAEALA